MSNGLASIVFPVDDLEKSKPVFNALLGVEPHTDTPYYVGYRVNDLEIALNPHARANGQETAIAYWAVKDLQAAIDGLIAAGGTLASVPNDVGGGTTIATVTDPSGNVIGLITGPDQQ